MEWILPTTLPIQTQDEISSVIEYYTSRRMIEIFFKTLKSGCKVESLQFEEMSRLLPCLGIYLIVTWRVLMVCRLGRSMPNAKCELIFDPAEWKATCRILYPKKKLPKKPPTLNAMLRMVGELGGWIAKSNREDMPGPQTTWIATSPRFCVGMEYVRPDAQIQAKDV